ncbi:class A sortase [Marinilactibacillus sp. Marseille-P9653]|uniref:class A sortase n=1 Tax=Marinilactibacillus sp. Marseille-P9653 TaxID=2866583 RepID=UPI001CE4945F|nr:class A sortase [Marinilactibacillus sp. Marseille-P9653]
MSDKTKSKTISFLAAFLLILGLMFLAAEPLQNLLVQRRSAETLTVTTSDIEQNLSYDGDFDFESVEEVSITDVLKAQLSDSDLPVIGSIAIPEVGLHLSILKGLSNNNLLSGAGTMKQDQQMGQDNYSLASHNMKDPTLLFAPLHRAETGMKVYLTDASNFYVYEIVTHKIIDPTQVSVIEDTDEALVTLITCNYDGDKRLLTQGTLLDTIPVDESEEIASYFDLNESI